MQEYNQEQIEAQINENLKIFQEKNKKPSILLLGQTGTGKTTAALEYIFDDYKAKAQVGVGAEPCTQGIEFYNGENINVYDSEGYEIGRQEHYRDIVMEGFLKDSSKQGEDGIQAVWYFISGAGKKITDYDISLIKEIQSMNYYVALVISKIDEMSAEQLQDLKAAAQAEIDVPIFQLSINPEIKDNPALTDWNKLTDWTYQILPQIFQDRYVFALKEGLSTKQQQVHKWVIAAAASAAGVGAAPIPFADAPVLMGLQGVLIYKILRAYNINVAKGTVSSLLSALSVSQAGRWLCGQLLKLVPVLGSVANATVAGAITYALGKAVDTLCQTQARQLLNGEAITIDVDSMLSSTTFAESVSEQFLLVKDHIMDIIKKD